jgi:hypothetical protein
MSNYSLTINFKTLDELLLFTNAYNKIQTKAEMKTIKLNDKRGSKTSELHKRAKHYKQTHPGIPYRDCLIFVANNPDEINDSNNESSDETKDEYYSDTDTIIKQQLI